MLNLIDHPESFKSGTRVLNLVSRNKDAGDKHRTIVKISHSSEQFDRRVEELLACAKSGQRIYGSAEPRDIQKAIRSFKMAQLDADYEQDPSQFYRRIGSRWATALMKPPNVKKGGKLWLLDCDSQAEYVEAISELDVYYDRDFRYEYKSKSGHHILVKPFNATKCTEAFQKFIHKNAVILWAY